MERRIKGDGKVKRRMGGGRMGENELKMPKSFNYEDIILNPLFSRFIVILLNVTYLIR